MENGGSTMSYAYPPPHHTPYSPNKAHINIPPTRPNVIRIAVWSWNGVNELQVHRFHGFTEGRDAPVVLSGIMEENSLKIYPLHKPQLRRQSAHSISCSFWRKRKVLSVCNDVGAKAGGVYDCNGWNEKCRMRLQRGKAKQ